GLRRMRAFRSVRITPPRVSVRTAVGLVAGAISDAGAMIGARASVRTASAGGCFVFSALPQCWVSAGVTARYVATAVAAAGEGADFEAVFNRTESPFSERFAAPARVVALRDGRGIGRRGTMAGRRFDLGASALLELGGLRVVVGSLHRQLHEPAMLELHGVD